MKVPAQRSKLLVEIRDVEIELPGHAEITEVIALTAERQNLRALRAEMHVDRSAAAAAPADLKRSG